MKTVELKLSYDRSLLIPLEDFSAVIKTLEKCKFATRNSVRVDGDYKTFYQLAEFTSEMAMIPMPEFVTEWPMSDWEKEELAKERLKAEQEAAARDDDRSAIDELDDSFAEAGSND